MGGVGRKEKERDEGVCGECGRFEQAEVRSRRRYILAPCATLGMAYAILIDFALANSYFTTRMGRVVSIASSLYEIQLF